MAVLEPRQPDVQWWPAGGRGWRTVTISQPLGAGDQVRTGPGAEARLVYFEGSMTELRPESALLLERGERSPDGALVVRLIQPQGSAVHHVRPSDDPAASFEVDTVAALVLARGATLRVQVASDGTTRVAHLPEGPDGTVWVQSTTEGSSQVALTTGQELVLAAESARRSPLQQ